MRGKLCAGHVPKPAQPPTLDLSIFGQRQLPRFGNQNILFHSSRNPPAIPAEESFVYRHHLVDRLAALDERARHFLKARAWLGGYTAATRGHSVETIRTRLLTSKLRPDMPGGKPRRGGVDFSKAKFSADEAFDFPESMPFSVGRGVLPCDSPATRYRGNGRANKGDSQSQRILP